MNYSICSFVLVLVFICISCTDSPNSENDIADSTPDSVANVDTLFMQADTLVKDSLEILRDVSNWKPEDFIVDEDVYSTAELWANIEWQLEQMKGLKSPFVAKFTTCEIGDYFHLNFEA